MNVLPALTLNSCISIMKLLLTAYKNETTPRVPVSHRKTISSGTEKLSVELSN